MAGGEFEMDYNRENSYYHAYCLSHDVIDIFSMVADSAFEPKTSYQQVWGFIRMPILIN
jgi:hypothetical protein